MTFVWLYTLKQYYTVSVTALWPLHIDNFAFMDIKMQEAIRLLQSAREEIARLQQLKTDAESAVQEALLDMQNTER